MAEPEESCFDASSDFVSDDECCWTPDWHGVDCKGDCPLCEYERERKEEGKNGTS